jgi:hypothetical protein
MPYITLNFDETKIPQARIDKIKPLLPEIIAKAMSSLDNASGPWGERVKMEESFKTAPSAIFVKQYIVHPTDQNAAPFEIYIEAGQARGRDPEKVRLDIAAALVATGLLPPSLLGFDKSCIFIVFHEVNAFGYIGD